VRRHCSLAPLAMTDTCEPTNAFSAFSGYDDGRRLFILACIFFPGVVHRQTRRDMMEATLRRP
jgi:hypothetical protein